MSARRHYTDKLNINTSPAKHQTPFSVPNSQHASVRDPSMDLVESDPCRRHKPKKGIKMKQPMETG